MVSFWTDDISVLYGRDYAQIIPTSNMTSIEKLNAIARFAFCYTILCICMKKSDQWLILGVFMIFMTIVVHHWGDDKHKEKEKFSGKKKCRKPTKDNPFMNPSVNDYGTDNYDVQAANVDDEDIKDDIKMSFSEDLFMNAEDLFDKKNSERQFFTIPSKVPPNQKDFAEWCYGYGARPSCKVDQGTCLKYEDLRYARFPHVNAPSAAI